MAIIRPLGREIYLFQDDSGRSVENLMIVSHGRYMPRPEFGRQTGLARNIPGLGGWIEVPAGVTLYLYGPHKSAIYGSMITEVLDGEAKHFETLRSPQKIRNYRLSKFQADSDTYGSIKKEIDLNRRSAGGRGQAMSYGGNTILQMIAANFPGTIPRFDILTIRNRAWMYTVSLQDVFKALERWGFRYSNIHCVFCRSRIIGTEPVYTPEHW
ncbi:hypothetical protein KC131_05195 [Pseudomonas sp. JQ170]|uniref:putative adhesin n=1 Tax=unclassified Pseudomonas TaxID=196821 RepID=UPI00264B0F05|nr:MULTISPECIES: hypothetical protein [unclassified Pseudomonas]MDN7140034.1 hypothetical protein [Pseudomonas sp. JQ170]WRO78606.1 hypothetical protein U9R80_13335 [Pseudomonas sp. 170C]